MTTIAELNEILVKQGSALDEFIKKHLGKVSAIETELNLCSKEIGELMKKADRAKYSSNCNSDSESKNDLADYIRSRGEVKNMFSASGPDGGWTVNPVLADGIGGIVRQNSALRELLNFIPLPMGDAYEEVISITPVGANWVGESQTRAATDSPKLVKVKTVLHEEYANPVISQRLADDSSTNMIDFLVSETSLSFTEAEELALFHGDGINKPLGLDSITTAATADSSRTWGVIEHVPTGASGAFDTTEGVQSFDVIKKLFYRLRSGYRTNAKWVCNSETALEISKIKDGQGNYIWDQGNVKDFMPPTLLGKPVVICETAPGIAANAKALWFGDWDQAIRAIERPGNKVLLDPYSEKPNVMVYVYRRIGLQLRNSNAIKCLKFSAN